MRLCLVSRQSGYLFEPADMLFLVLFEFGPFQVNNLNLSRKIVLNRLVVFSLLLQLLKLRVDALFLLPYPVLILAYLPVLFQYLFIMFRL